MAFPEGGVREQTRQSLLNLKAVLEQSGASLDTVLKTTCFLAKMEDFSVFNEVYSEFFGDSGAPARSCIQAGKLPKEALVGNAVNLLMTILICSHSILVTSG